MDIEGNHYQVLGIDVTAPRDDIEVAVQRLSDQAATLVYASPERSHDLWERVREIRADLLADPERRSDYDRSLLSSDTPAATASREPVLVIASRLPPRPRERQDKPASGFPFWGTLVGGTTAAVLIALAAAVTHGPQSPALRPPLALGTSGSHNGSAFVSGQEVRLHWAAVSHATLYRLQVATTSVDPRINRVAFHHPLLTATMRATTYGLKVVGAQRYYWRVQAKVHGVWSRFTRPRLFLVAHPALDRPIALVSALGPTQTIVRKKLCWSAVKGAVGYQLRVTGVGTITTHGRCAWVMVAPGTHRWQVAALIRGARLYRGAYSRPARFTIAPPAHRARRAHRARTTVLAANVPRKGTTTYRKRTGVSHPVAVALVNRPSPHAVHAGGAPKKPSAFVARARKPASVVSRSHHPSSTSGSHSSRKHALTPPPPPSAPASVASAPRSPSSAAPPSQPAGPVVYVQPQATARPTATRSTSVVTYQPPVSATAQPHTQPQKPGKPDHPTKPDHPAQPAKPNNSQHPKHP